MKKVYEKPRILLEKFTLTQSVAQACGFTEEGQLSHTNKGSCGFIDWSGDVLWHIESGCTVETDDDANVGGICYNEPADGVTIFAS